jgi:LmbE family N-acetylglucosaminyl deacetylase
MSKVVAVVVAHPDDEVLGCGGTLARLSTEGYQVHILLMADGESSRSEIKQGSESEIVSARNIAAEKACSILGCMSVTSLNLPDNRLDSLDRLDIIKHIEGFIAQYSPSMVFTHHAGDVNIDHRIVHDAVIVACRPQPRHSVKDLLFFEVPSSTEWRPFGSNQIFAPDVFYDITATLPKKLDALQVYERELRPFPHPRSLKAVEALAHWRGATVGVDAAEAFMLGRRIV